MSNLYNATFSALHVANVRGLKAPHKAILLLSVIDLIEEHVITSPYIQLSDELLNKFSANWHRYVSAYSPFTADIGKPWYHLQHENFWRLIAKEKATELNPPERPNYGVSSLRSLYDCAIIDASLFATLQSADARAELRCVLISHYCNQPSAANSNITRTLLLLAMIAGVA